LLNDFFAMIFMDSAQAHEQWAQDAAENLQNDLLCGEGGMISAEPARKIRELAELAADNAGFVKLLCEARLPEIQGHLDAVPKFKSAYRGYLARFGDRCLGELKLESLTLHEDPLPLLRSVGRLARLSFCDTDPIRSEVDSGERRSAQRADNALAGHPLRRRLFRWVLRHARARVRDRENLRFERTRLFGHVRRVFVELGRRLHAEGHLSEARDIFFLEIDELLGYLAGSATTTKLKPLVLLRQAEFAEYRTEEPPPGFHDPWAGLRRLPLG
jgi:pyruvate,water dikinase